jgi:hypothetical protein
MNTSMYSSCVLTDTENALRCRSKPTKSVLAERTCSTSAVTRNPFNADPDVPPVAASMVRCGPAVSCGG